MKMVKWKDRAHYRDQVNEIITKAKETIWPCTMRIKQTFLSPDMRKLSKRATKIMANRKIK